MNKKQIIASIDKLRLWRAGNWIPYDTNASLTLRIHFDQLLIISGTKVLESFNINGKIKGVYKQDVLVLLVSDDVQQVRKIKFKLKSDTSKILQQLCQHFPIAKYQIPSRKINMKYRNVEELFKNALEKLGDGTINLPLPDSYFNFVKLSLLDPHFPIIVKETEKIIENILKTEYK